MSLWNVGVELALFLSLKKLKWSISNASSQIEVVSLNPPEQPINQLSHVPNLVLEDVNISSFFLLSLFMQGKHRNILDICFCYSCEYPRISEIIICSWELYELIFIYLPKCPCTFSHLQERVTRVL